MIGRVGVSARDIAVKILAKILGSCSIFSNNSIIQLL